MAEDRESKVRELLAAHGLTTTRAPGEPGELRRLTLDLLAAAAEVHRVEQASQRMSGLREAALAYQRDL